MFKIPNRPTPTFFRQVDPRWNTVPLNNTNLVVGSAGCLLCTFASLISSYEHQVTPLQLNRFCARNGLYTKEARLSLYVPMWYGFVDYRVFNCENTPAPVGRLLEMLEGGWEAIIQVKPPQQWRIPEHWLWVWGYKKDDLLVHDTLIPVPHTSIVSLLEKFSPSDWDLARTITRIALYKPGEKAYEDKANSKT